MYATLRGYFPDMILKIIWDLGTYEAYMQKINFIWNLTNELFWTVNEVSIFSFELKEVANCVACPVFL